MSKPPMDYTDRKFLVSPDCMEAMTKIKFPNFHETYAKYQEFCKKNEAELKKIRREVLGLPTE